VFLGVCCTEERSSIPDVSEARIEDPQEALTAALKATDQETVRAAPKQLLVGEDKLGGLVISKQSIPRCSSYYGVAVAPPPATPRCTTFSEVPQTGPSEVTTRLPSVPEDEMHCAPEPCKWDPVFLSLMLMHLDKAEDLAYGEVWAGLTGDNHSLTLDCPELHTFLLANSVLTVSDIDQVLRQVADEDGHLDQAAFLELLRDNAMLKATAESWFQRALALDTSSNGKDLTRESCLAGLRLFVAKEAERLPQSALDEKQLERICASAMKEDIAEISLENWCGYCRKAARTISLARHCSDTTSF